jgi:N-acetylmuramic acid 6-phosphate etherase
MVDVAPANEKLRERVRRMVGEATGASAADVDAALEAAEGDTRVAIVSLLADVDAESARASLEESGRSIGRALESR